MVVGVVVVVAGLVGGGVWAWSAFFGQGAQPAEALPDDTLAYVALDLDPSGEQKVEAVRFLRQFPAIKEELDLDTDDDVKMRIFEQIQEEGACEDLDYGADIEPWLGDRAAFALVDRGDDDPAFVVVAQIKDEDTARDGIDKIIECDSGAAGDKTGGFAFTGDWAVIAETTAIAEEIVADGADSSLSEDEDFQRLTDEAGDPGVLNMYAAPAAGSVLMEELGEDILDELGSEFGGGEAGTEIAEEFTAAIEQFPGAAGALRFDGGDVEFELATGELDAETREVLVMGGDQAGDVAGGLPDSTAAAFAFSLPEGWADSVMKLIGPSIEQDLGMPLDDAIAELEAETGLSIPEDIETLAGEGLVLAVDDSIAADDLEGMDPSEVPAGIRVKGDPEEIEEVLDKLRSQAGSGFANLIVSESDGDFVAIGTNEEYVERLAEGGDLGGKATFEDVVPQSDDASTIYYIDFDANDWLDDMVAEFEDDEAAENVEPLSSFGLSTWVDDDKSHLLLKLRTE